MYFGLSLRSHCRQCGSKCCIPGETIGAPIVSEEERTSTLRLCFFDEDHFQKVILGNSKYYYVPKKTERGQCIFLNEDGTCLVQEVKFADCAEYPLKAVWRNRKVFYLIDIHCPAARYLTAEFIAKAKEVALASLNRWDSEVYQHWLDYYIAWIADAMELEEYLKLTAEQKAALPIY